MTENPWFVKKYRDEKIVSPELWTAHIHGQLPTDVALEIAAELVTIKNHLVNARPFGSLLHKMTVPRGERPRAYELQNFIGKWEEEEEGESELLSPRSFEIVAFPNSKLRLIHILKSYAEMLMSVDEEGDMRILWCRGSFQELVRTLGVMRHHNQKLVELIECERHHMLVGMNAIKDDLVNAFPFPETNLPQTIAVFSATEPNRVFPQARMHLAVLSKECGVIVAADKMCSVLIALDSLDEEMIRMLKVTQYAYIDDLRALSKKECTIVDVTFPSSLLTIDKE